MKSDESEKDRPLRVQIEEILSYMAFAFNPDTSASGTVFIGVQLLCRWDLNSYRRKGLICLSFCT